MDIQRIRNLTTGSLHTDMDHVYKDIEYIVGEKGIMTHMIPNACSSLEPYLRKHVKDDRFWNGEHDPKHVGEIDIPIMNNEEKSDFWDRYENMNNPLKKLAQTQKQRNLERNEKFYARHGHGFGSVGMSEKNITALRNLNDDQLNSLLDMILIGDIEEIGRNEDTLGDWNKPIDDDDEESRVRLQMAAALIYLSGRLAEDVSFLTRK